MSKYYMLVTLFTMLKYFEKINFKNRELTRQNVTLNFHLVFFFNSVENKILLELCVEPMSV
jgi:hypothetical protein